MEKKKKRSALQHRGPWFLGSGHCMEFACSSLWLGSLAHSKDMLAGSWLNLTLIYVCVCMWKRDPRLYAPWGRGQMWLFMPRRSADPRKGIKRTLRRVIVLSPEIHFKVQSGDGLHPFFIAAGFNFAFHTSLRFKSQELWCHSPQDQFVENRCNPPSPPPVFRLWMYVRVCRYRPLMAFFSVI